MIFEYVQSLYSWNFKKHNKIKKFIHEIIDNIRYKKIMSHITSEKSNYTLLLDLSNTLETLIQIYGFEKTLDILKPYVDHYHRVPYRSVMKHSVLVSVDDDTWEYKMEVTYTTRNSISEEDKANTEYYVTITNKRSKISNGYSLYSNTVYKFPELDNFINITIRLSLQRIVTTIRKYIIDNQEVI